MKDLLNKIVSSAHLLILMYGLYGAWVMYDEHSIQLQEIIDQDTGLDEEIVRSKKKVKEIREFSKKTDVYKLRVEEVAKSIESVQKQLPAETNDAQIMTYLQSETNALNIKDIDLKPGKEEKSTYFISKEYNIQGKGTFLQFLIFLERIGKADRIYNIKELKLANLKEKQRGRFQMISGEGVIQAFRYNPDFKVERGF
jgi:Tfp pilus assembly protein PilO